MIDQLLERETQPVAQPWFARKRVRLMPHRFTVVAFAAFLVVNGFVGSSSAFAQEAVETEDTADTTQMVYPNSAPEATDADAGEAVYSDLMSESGSAAGMVVTILGYLVILAGLAVAVWFLFKRGVFRKTFANKEGKLKIAESRMLGNRQYIMVVEYEDNKILLGVGPGKIDYLTSLEGYQNDFPKLEPQLEKASVQELA